MGMEMDAQLSNLKNTARRVAAEADRANDALTDWKNNKNPAGQQLAQDWLSELGGELSKELFGKKRPGSKVVRTYLRDQNKKQKEQTIQRFKQYGLQLCSQLDRDVRSAKSAFPTRTHQSILRGIREAKNAKRPDTVFRRIRKVADRILDYEAPEPKPPKTGYETLKKLEQTLRDHVQQRLSSLTDHWWKQRVPPDVRENAERRKKASDNPWPWDEGRDLDLIHYVDFPDYAKMIEKRDNWKEAFSEDFQDKSWITTKLRELEPIRNDIAHMRDLSDRQLKKLELYTEEILPCLER